MRPGRRGLLLFGVALLLAAPVAQARRQRHAARDSLPGWLQQALEREVGQAETDAVWLHEELQVAPLATGGVRYHVRRAARLMREGALPRFVAASHYYRKGDKLGPARAWSIDGASKVVAADEKRDVSTAPAMAGYSVFDDSRIRWINLPSLRAGPVAAWEDSWVAMLDTGARHHLFGSAERRTAWSQFSLALPAGWHYDLALDHADEIGVDRGKTSVVLHARDLARPSADRLRPPAREFLPSAWPRWGYDAGARGPASSRIADSRSATRSSASSQVAGRNAGITSSSSTRPPGRRRPPPSPRTSADSGPFG